MEIDKELAHAAVAAIERLSKEGTRQQKEHFTQVLAKLADCYGKDSTNQALVVINDSAEDSMYTISINADSWEAAGLIQMCYDNMNLKAFQKMPDNYYEN